VELRTSGWPSLGAAGHAGCGGGPPVGAGNLVSGKVRGSASNAGDTDRDSVSVGCPAVLVVVQQSVGIPHSTSVGTRSISHQDPILLLP
jgi:hypothetical protein